MNTTAVRVSRVTPIAVAVLLSAAAASAGQRVSTATDTSATTTESIGPGWSLTPALLLSRTYDDNVLLRGPGNPAEADYINVINPRGDLNYTGRLGQFSAQYDGAFVVYRDMNTLNSYDQHGGVSAKRRLSKRTSLFFNGSLTAAPTTEFLEFTGVPFVRAGVFTDDIRAGVESMLSKRVTVSAGAHFEQARFDASQTYANLLLGGNSIGMDVSLRDRLTERMTLTADADMQHATIGTAEDQFDIQHAMVGLERQLTPRMHAYASAGISRLGVTSYGPSRTGPSWKLGLVQHYRSTTIDISYNRSFVPSFGFGGTMQNEDVTARIRLPITHRIYTQNLVSRRHEDPLVLAVPSLSVTWIESSIGYAVRPWVRIEGYYVGSRQTVGLPDAMLEHNQFGIQVITSKPVRIH